MLTIEVIAYLNESRGVIVAKLLIFLNKIMSNKSAFLKSTKMAIAGIVLTSGLAACGMLSGKHSCSKNACASKVKDEQAKCSSKSKDEKVKASSEVKSKHSCSSKHACSAAKK